MRNVLLDERDHTLWDCDMVQQDYEFFKRHKDAFVRMWHVQGSLYWQRFIATYRRYYVHYGLLRSLPYDDEDKLHQVLLDQAFMYIQDCFLQEKVTSAIQLINDLVVVAKNQHLLKHMDSSSTTRNPFFYKESRAVFRTLFGNPNEPQSRIKVILCIQLYLRFAGAICNCLKRWLTASELPDGDESYWPKKNNVDMMSKAPRRSLKSEDSAGGKTDGERVIKPPRQPVKSSSHHDRVVRPPRQPVKSTSNSAETTGDTKPSDQLVKANNSSADIDRCGVAISKERPQSASGSDSNASSQVSRKDPSPQTPPPTIGADGKVVILDDDGNVASKRYLRETIECRKHLDLVKFCAERRNVRLVEEVNFGRPHVRHEVESRLGKRIIFRVADDRCIENLIDDLDCKAVHQVERFVQVTDEGKTVTHVLILELGPSFDPLIDVEFVKVPKEQAVLMQSISTQCKSGEKGVRPECYEPLQEFSSKSYPSPGIFYRANFSQTCNREGHDVTMMHTREGLHVHRLPDGMEVPYLANGDEMPPLPDGTRVTHLQHNHQHGDGCNCDNDRIITSSSHVRFTTRNGKKEMVIDQDDDVALNSLHPQLQHKIKQDQRAKSVRDRLRKVHEQRQRKQLESVDKSPKSAEVVKHRQIEQVDKSYDFNSNPDEDNEEDDDAIPEEVLQNYRQEMERRRRTGFYTDELDTRFDTTRADEWIDETFDTLKVACWKYHEQQIVPKDAVKLSNKLKKQIRKDHHEFDLWNIDARQRRVLREIFIDVLTDFERNDLVNATEVFLTNKPRCLVNLGVDEIMDDIMGHNKKRVLRHMIFDDPDNRAMLQAEMEIAAAVAKIEKKSPKPKEAYKVVSRRLREPTDSPKSAQQPPDNSKHAKQPTDSPKSAHQPADSSKHVQQASNNSKHAQQSSNNSKHTKQASNNSKHAQQSSNNSKHTKQASNSPKRGHQPADSSKHGQQTADSSKHAQQTADRSKTEKRNVKNVKGKHIPVLQGATEQPKNGISTKRSSEVQEGTATANGAAVEENELNGNSASFSSEEEQEVEEQEVNVEPELRKCAHCHRPESRRKEYKKCIKCYLMEFVPASYYCCKPCQIADWFLGHKKAHARLELDLSESNYNP